MPDPVEIWFQGFGIRLEACRQGGLLCSAIITVLGLWSDKAKVWATVAVDDAAAAIVAANTKKTRKTLFAALASLVFGVLMAGMAHWLIGESITSAAVWAANASTAKPPIVVTSATMIAQIKNNALYL